ncbi:uncharacterized protein BDR25DRAFT_279954 [Lindgomyces ingoldianus]|uniref:Uncharacterized protein n=1 Tax=Lindgomyces ingoldianus TaxID=673940 RepID=A0ACB6R5N9_9PLEO|nr:uncharacterized protein BDR25DRAFT_279954 [Lindgomyces ingoldianus]KAF2474584.1 hypothetical protein BDR25DRAFT_279954 [Lindgomyces ingoldianus]
MLGINYPSSDEEDVEATPNIQPKAEQSTQEDSCATLQTHPRPSSPARSGPDQGPSVTPASRDTDAGGTASTPQSPYSSYRSIVQNITLPTVPNFDIPPSPPGSPLLGPTKKFALFLDMKRKGQHFNKRMAGSSALQNPAHFQKLMGFAGLKDEDQYASTLPVGAAVPTAFPKSAYVEQLAQSQKEITKAKEKDKARVQREAIDFVPSTNSSESRKPAMLPGRGSSQSATERVMASLDRERSSSASSHDRDKRREPDRRGGRDDRPSKGRQRSRSRSPKRRRSMERNRGRESRWGI